jgi:Na+/H+ antiporter NhaC
MSASVLPDISYAIFGLHFLAGTMDRGWLGVLRAFLLAFFILGLSSILTRLKIRMQL